MPDPFAFPFATTGAYPTRDGNLVRWWIDGEPTLERICQAIEVAQHSVWVTVTFMWDAFQMPGGRGSALQVLERAAGRGVDVRVVFWRPDEETAALRKNAFWGAPQHVRRLRDEAPHLSVRWDRAQPGYCQHQKMWLIDAGHPTQVAFIGSVNLNPHSLVAPGHAGEGHNHDTCVELRGPALADVHHNFVQRWNEASERLEPDGTWGVHGALSLGFPTALPAVSGTARVQIQRTVHAGRSRNPQGTVGAPDFDIAAGERTNLSQYLLAIHAARQTIYLEHQAFNVPEIIGGLHEALQRGVAVILVLPDTTDPALTGRSREQSSVLREISARLEAHRGLTLCGLAGLGNDGRRAPVHVHSKVLLVDDVWVSMGSANAHHHSMFGNAELNAAVYSPEDVRSFRVALFAEHLGVDTAALDDRAAFALFRQIASANRHRGLNGDHRWQGLAFQVQADEPVSNP
jgi:phosphatidylserine/phosphatidylglycerophosphate/cardiolipin synthase-like enzyme